MLEDEQTLLHLPHLSVQKSLNYYFFILYFFIFKTLCKTALHESHIELKLLAIVLGQALF